MVVIYSCLNNSSPKGQKSLIVMIPLNILIVSSIWFNYSYFGGIRCQLFKKSLFINVTKHLQRFLYDIHS